MKRWPGYLHGLVSRLLRWVGIIRTPQRQVGGYHLTWDLEI